MTELRIKPNSIRIKQNTTSNEFFNSNAYCGFVFEKNMKSKLSPPKKHIKGSSLCMELCSECGCVVHVVVSGTGQQELSMECLCCRASCIMY